MTERKVMIKSLQSLPVTRQCQILDLARSTAYYTPVPVSERDLLVMRTMDKFHLDYPFAGSRTLCDWLNRGICSRPGACAYVDAAHGHSCHILSTQDQSITSGAHDLSVSVAISGYQSA